MSAEQDPSATSSEPAAPLLSFDPIGRLLQARVLDPPSRPGLLANLDQYEILRILGMGGMGLVLLARAAGSEKRVAIKLLRPELVGEPHAVHRFLVEARHTQKLAHPNILQIIEVADRPHGPYFVMPYMERGSLAQLLRPGEPLDPQMTLRVCLDIADALAFAHDKGIIHRDLKPGNVLLDGSGRTWLADFGLGRTTLVNESIVDPNMPQCQGTAPYLAPEVAAGKAGDFRCDIYAFGAMLYEMLSGRWPYDGRTSQEIVQQVLAGPPQPLPPSSVPLVEGLSRVAETAMARELRDRYAHMSDVMADLRGIERGGRPHLRKRARRGFRWRLAVTITLSTALLVLAVLLAYRKGGDSKAPTSGVIAHESVPRERLIFADHFDGSIINDKLWRWGEQRRGTDEQSTTARYQLSQNHGLLLLETEATSEHGWSSLQDLWLDHVTDLKEYGEGYYDLELSCEAMQGGCMVFITENTPDELVEPDRSVRLLDLLSDRNHPLPSTKRRIRVEIAATERAALVRDLDASPDTQARVFDLSNLESWHLRFYAVAATSGSLPPAKVRFWLDEVTAVRGLADRPKAVGFVRDVVTSRPATGVEVAIERSKPCPVDDWGAYELPVAAQQSTAVLQVSGNGYEQVEPNLFVMPKVDRHVRLDILVQRQPPRFGDAIECMQLPFDQVHALAVDDTHVYLTATKDGSIHLFRQTLPDGRFEPMAELAAGTTGLGLIENRLVGTEVYPGRLYQFDPQGRMFLEHNPKLDWPYGVAFDGKRVWYLECDTERNKVGLYAEDPATREPLGWAVSADMQVCGLTYGDGLLWICSHSGRIYGADPEALLSTGRLDAATRKSFDGHYLRLAYGAGSLWGLNHETFKLCRLQTSN